MTAKGTITGNDAADRILRDEAPCSEKALRRVIAGERLRTIASLRGQLDRALDASAARRVVDTVLDAMEAAPA